MHRAWRSARPLDVAATLSVLGRGRRDPVHRQVGRTTWCTAMTPCGGVLTAVTQIDDHSVDAHAWGEGANWRLEHLPDLLGEHDGTDGFIAHDAPVREARRQLPGLRIPRTGCVMDALALAVLEQRVVGLDATASRIDLVTRYGSPVTALPGVPGDVPPGLVVPPDAAGWRRVPSWAWHTAGVDGQRSRALIRAAQVAGRLQETVTMPRDEAQARFFAIPGIGEWTWAETAKIAHGDADAVSVGDYHLGRVITWALTGRMDGTDDDMLALLEPYRPNRQLAVRLLERAALPRMPRRAPRMARQDFRRI